MEKTLRIRNLLNETRKALVYMKNFIGLPEYETPEEFVIAKGQAAEDGDKFFNPLTYQMFTHHNGDWVSTMKVPNSN